MDSEWHVGHSVSAVLKGGFTHDVFKLDGPSLLSLNLSDLSPKDDEEVLIKSGKTIRGSSFACTLASSDGWVGCSLAIDCPVTLTKLKSIENVIKQSINSIANLPLNDYRKGSYILPSGKRVSDFELIDTNDSSTSNIQSNIVDGDVLLMIKHYNENDLEHMVQSLDKFGLNVTTDELRKIGEFIDTLS